MAHHAEKSSAVMHHVHILTCILHALLHTYYKCIPAHSLLKRSTSSSP